MPNLSIEDKKGVGICFDDCNGWNSEECVIAKE